MTTTLINRVSRPRWAALFLAMALALASCTSGDDTATSSPTPLGEPVTETTLASEPVVSTTETTVPEESDAQTDTTDDLPGTIEPPDEDPGESNPDESNWESSPFADAVIDVDTIEALFGGSWSSDTPELTEPEESDSETCGVADPATFNGISTNFVGDENLELAHLIQSGDGVDVWVTAFEGLASCDGPDELDVELVEITVDGADSSAIVFSNNNSGEGYASGGAARRGDVLVAVVAFADSPGLLPTPEAVAELLSVNLGEAVVLANTDAVPEGPPMALTEDDLTDVGLGADFERIRFEEVVADLTVEAFGGEACELVDPARYDGFNNELVGPFGDPRIVQIVTTSSDESFWIESFVGQAGCGEQGGIPVVRADLWIDGADDAVVLSPDGVDADGTSYAMAAGVAGDVSVAIIVFADTPDDPALDPRVISQLAAIALARR